MVMKLASLLVVLYTALASSIFNYGFDKIRGVNLGGWLLTEPFITPSIYGLRPLAVDEYTLCKSLGPGKDLAKQVLEKHWDTWYTRSDFLQMAEYGINLVRIPIGYWAFELLPYDPYVQGQEAYLDRAIEWARDAGLTVWLDLHGAPGSQNGFDNSGQRDVLKWQTGNNVNTTLQVLKYMATKYGSAQYQNTVTGIALLNEPMGWKLDMDQVKSFYTDGLKVMHDAGSYAAVIIHDAFMPLGYWDNFMPDSHDNNTIFTNVILDHHQYQIFSAGEIGRDIDTHVKAACNYGATMRKEPHLKVTGEWSAALTDCAPWLNGVNRGARYDGQFDNSPLVGSCYGILDFKKWSKQRLEDTRRYAEAQLDAYEQGDGWIFWTWKTEIALEWDMKQLVENGLFPMPFTDRKFPNQCTF